MISRHILQFLSLLLAVNIDLAQCRPASLQRRVPQDTTTPIIVPDKSPRTQVIQVVPPPIADASGACQVSLMPEQYFAGWGATFRGKYTPPQNCPGPWSHVILNLKVVGQSNTYDRRGTMWLGKTMIWEMSTAEPNNRVTEFDYSKELGQFHALWSAPQDFIFSLPTDPSPSTSGINATVTMTFVRGQPAEKFADIVVPVAKGAGSTYNFPSDNKNNAFVSYKSPTASVERATVQIFASGTLGEEFWEHQDDNKFNQQMGQAGNGSYREIQFLIDDKIAGIYLPFPNVYSGGLNYLFWDNEVAIQTYDVPSYTMSLEPWLHVLADGNSHKLGFNVVGQDGQLNPGGWFVAGNVKLWKGVDGGKTTGSFLAQEVDANPTITATGGKAADGISFTTHVDVTRKVNIVSRISRPSDNGATNQVFWNQHLTYTNDQTYTPNKAYSVKAVTAGMDTDTTGLVFHFNYPYSYSNAVNGLELTESIDHSWDWTAKFSRDFAPLGVTGMMWTQQKGTASKAWHADLRAWIPDAGHMSQSMKFLSDGRANGVADYERTLAVDNRSVLSDSEQLNGQPYRSGPSA